MATLLKYEEWQSTSGYWHCNNIAPKIGKWWYVPRMLEMTPAEYVEFLHKNFQPDSIQWDGKTLLFCWKSQAKMRKFKNYVNAEARKRKFYL
jgi:hypothetical protein